MSNTNPSGYFQCDKCGENQRYDDPQSTSYSRVTVFLVLWENDNHYLDDCRRLGQLFESKFYFDVRTVRIPLSTDIKAMFNTDVIARPIPERDEEIHARRENESEEDFQERSKDLPCPVFYDKTHLLILVYVGHGCPGAPLTLSNGLSQVDWIDIEEEFQKRYYCDSIQILDCCFAGYAVPPTHFADHSYCGINQPRRELFAASDKTTPGNGIYTFTKQITRGLDASLSSPAGTLTTLPALQACARSGNAKETRMWRWCSIGRQGAPIVVEPCYEALHDYVLGLVRTSYAAVISSSDEALIAVVPPGVFKPFVTQDLRIIRTTMDTTLGDAINNTPLRGVGNWILKSARKVAKDGDQVSSLCRYGTNLVVLRAFNTKRFPAPNSDIWLWENL